MIKHQNGRVDIMTPDTSTLFGMKDKNPVKQCSTFRDATEGQWEESVLSNAYFSGQNMQIIQNGIRAEVYNKSNGQLTIGEQDCDSLKIIMRSIFLQHAINQPNNISEQIESLNQMVLDYIVPRVYSEALGYNKYLSDVSTMYKPMDRPVMAKNNDKQLELKPWF